MSLQHRRRMATRQMNVPWMTLKVTQAGVCRTFHFSRPRKWWLTGPYQGLGPIIERRLKSPPDSIEYGVEIEEWE